MASNHHIPPLTSSDRAHYCSNSPPGHPQRPTPPTPGLIGSFPLWVPTSCSRRKLLSHGSLQYSIPLVLITKSPHCLQHLSAVFPSFNVSTLVPFSCLSGYGTFFLLHLNYGSMDYLIKDPHSSAFGLGLSSPLCFSYSPSFSGPVVSLSCVVHLHSYSYQLLSFLFTICSVLPVTAHHPLAWKPFWPLKKPCGPKTYSLLCILTHLVFSVTA